MNYEQWRAADPERGGDHVDFGHGWTGADAVAAHRVSWVPTTGELYAVPRHGGGAVEVLEVVAGRAEVEEILAGWPGQVDEPGSLVWLRDALARHRQRLKLPAPTADGGQPALGGDDGELVEPGWLALREQELDRREEQLARRERSLVEGLAALGTAVPVEPAWDLPAAPVAGYLQAVRRLMGDSIETVARGFELDPAWVAGVLKGSVDRLGLPEVARVCEVLQCSPYDLWGVTEARRIVHAYGPELWPRHILPLEAEPDIDGPQPADGVDPSGPGSPDLHP